MANPLPPTIHRNPDQKFDLGHFKWRRVPMPQQIANQCPIVGNAFGSRTVTDPSRLDDRRIVSHVVDETNESVIEHGKFFPTQLFQTTMSRTW